MSDVHPEDFYEAQDMPLGDAKRHLMVCCGPRCNDPETNKQTYERFLRKIEQRGLNEGEHKTMVTPVECTGICVDGSCAYVLPDETYYHEISNTGVDAIVNQHLAEDKPVDSLLLDQ